MFVISLIYNGKLKQSAFKSDPNDAVKIAQEWYEVFSEEFEEGGYIVIDHQVKGKTENVRFAEMKLDQSDDEVKLYFATNQNVPVYQTSYRGLMKNFLFAFMRAALETLSDYLKDKK